MNSVSPIGPTGEQLRDAALGLLRAHRADVIRDCTAAALHVALTTGQVTADDVRAAVPIPPTISPKLVGAVFRELADAGILERVGFVSSGRPVAHARPLSVWRLADRAAAARRLGPTPAPAPPCPRPRNPGLFDGCDDDTPAVGPPPG